MPHPIPQGDLGIFVTSAAVGHPHDGVRQYVASLAATAAFKQSARERRKVEMLFAHLQRHLNFRRVRLRGRCARRMHTRGFRKLVKLIGFRPPPLSAACASSA
jgi:hypothetical protein